MYRYFKIEEFDCKETGKNEMQEEFIHKLDQLRHACGVKMIITSGYRDKSHSVEVNKKTTGTHVRGIAADIRCLNGAERMKIVSEALRLGFTGIGVAKKFVHVDTRTTRPVMWLYS